MEQEVREQIKELEDRAIFLDEWIVALSEKCSDSLSDEFELHDKIYHLKQELKAKQNLIDIRKKDLDSMLAKLNADKTDCDMNIFKVYKDAKAKIKDTPPPQKEMLEGFVERYEAKNWTGDQHRINDYKAAKEILR